MSASSFVDGIGRVPSDGRSEGEGQTLIRLPEAHLVGGVRVELNEDGDGGEDELASGLEQTQGRMQERVLEPRLAVEALGGGGDAAPKAAEDRGGRSVGARGQLGGRKVDREDVEHPKPTPEDEEDSRNEVAAPAAARVVVMVVMVVFGGGGGGGGGVRGWRREGCVRLAEGLHEGGAVEARERSSLDARLTCVRPNAPPAAPVAVMQEEGFSVAVVSDDGLVGVGVRGGREIVSVIIC